MCIVIDTNTFSSIFQPTSKNHNEFKPVLNWIVSGKGKIVFGGAKYKQELRIAYKYLGFFGELSKLAKIIEVDEDRVNEEEKLVKNILGDCDCNDFHIIAIIRVSGCKLICSEDRKAYTYFTRSNLYQKHKRPRIYSQASNSDLLCDRNIADICKPCDRLPKATSLELLSQF